MGTIATMKGNHGNMYTYGATNGNNIRRKWNMYLLTLIILLVFGAAVLGLMGIHRLRDRRIFNLLIKDKDFQILSLQHFLQNEKKRVRDDKMTIEGMKSKIFSLRAHNKELNKQVSEMESTIALLKDEQKIIESALDEKQNEVFSLRQSFEEIKDQNPQIQALEEMLKQKEVEIQILHNHIQLPTNQNQFKKVEKDGNNTHFNGDNIDAENKRGVDESIMGNAANEEKEVSEAHAGEDSSIDVSNKETNAAEVERTNTVEENETISGTDRRLFEPINQTRVEDISNVVRANMTDEILKKPEQVENTSSVKSQILINRMPEQNANNDTSGSYIQQITQNVKKSVETKNSEKLDDSYGDEAHIEGPEF